MKKFIIIALAASAMVMPFSGCNGDKDKEPQTTITNFEDISDKLAELGEEIADLKQRAEELKENGAIDEDKYNTIISLDERLTDIGSEGSRENMLKYNELKKIIDELKYDLSAAEDPQKTDEDTALKSLMDCVNEVEPSVISAHDSGKLPDDRFNLFNEYKNEVQGYIDGTAQRGENLTDRLAQIRTEITTIASQAEADNEVIDKLLAQPVKVEDNLKLEELISNYIELQNEVQTKVNNGEMDVAKLNELMVTGVKVAQVKEALQTGNITDETRQTITECNTELKAFADGIGSPTAQYFD